VRKGIFIVLWTAAKDDPSRKGVRGRQCIWVCPRPRWQSRQGNASTRRHVAGLLLGECRGQGRTDTAHANGQFLASFHPPKGLMLLPKRSRALSFETLNESVRLDIPNFT